MTTTQQMKNQTSQGVSYLLFGVLANWRGKFPVLLCKIKETHQGKGVIIMKITIEQIPDTFEKFEEMADTQRTPELVCVLFLCALALFIRNREDGIAAMNLLRGPRPMQPMDSQFLQDRLRDVKNVHVVVSQIVTRFCNDTDAVLSNDSNNNLTHSFHPPVCSPSCGGNVFMTY